MSGRVVVVTGASSGIGRATAVACAGSGDQVVLAARAEESLLAAERECRAAGAHTLVVPTDVTDAAAVDALLAAAAGRFGRVDVVVHSVTVVAYGRFDEVPAAVFDRVIATTLTGAANVARATLRVFRAQGGGRLVLVGSLLGKIATPFMSSYVTAKWAVHGLARTLQLEARETPGVEVSLVSPGSVNTPVYSHAANYLGRAGRPPPPVDPPEKVARAVLRALDRPRREISVGVANPAIVLGFRALPAVFDRLVLPLMRLGGLSRRTVEAHDGNVFAPRPATDSTHGRWGRHWLRSAGAGLGHGRGRRRHRADGQVRDRTVKPPVGDGPDRSSTVSGHAVASVTRRVAASADDVWSVLADGWWYATWVVGASRIRDVDPGWPKEGTRVHHSFGTWPLLIDDSTAVLHAEPGRELVLRARGWPAGEATVRLLLTPDGPDTTVITLREDVSAGPGRLLPRPVRQLALTPRNAEALRRLGYLAEGRRRQRLSPAAAAGPRPPG